MSYLIYSLLIGSVAVAVALCFERGRDAIARWTSNPLPITQVINPMGDEVRALRAYLDPPPVKMTVRSLVLAVLRCVVCLEIATLFHRLRSFRRAVDPGAITRSF